MRSKIKILFILPSLSFGGAERVVGFIVENLNREKYIPVLLVIGKPHKHQLKIEDTEVVFLNKKRTLYSLFSIIYQIQKINPKIVFSSIGQVNLFVSFLRFFFKNRKVIIRETSIVSIVRKVYNLPQNKLYQTIESYLFKKYDSIIFQSKDMKLDFEKYYNFSFNQSTIINNPILFKESSEVIREHNNSLQILTIGNLNPIKGYDRIIKILGNLKIDFNYTIVGGGVLRDELEKLVENTAIQEKISFEGLQKDVRSYLKKADVFILGSYCEGFPNVLLEAMSFGIPCIAFNSSLGGHREIIKHGFNGYLVDEENEFHHFIEKSKHTNWDRKKIQEDVYDRFNASKILLEYETLFDRVSKE